MFQPAEISMIYIRRIYEDTIIQIEKSIHMCNKEIKSYVSMMKEK